MFCPNKLNVFSQFFLLDTLQVQYNYPLIKKLDFGLGCKYGKLYNYMG